VKKIGKFAKKFGAMRAIIKKVYDPVVHVIRNSHIGHFIEKGRVPDSVKGLTKIQGNNKKLRTYVESASIEVIMGSNVIRAAVVEPVRRKAN